MANVPLAFYVLSAFFGVYLVVALLRSRPVRKLGQDERPAPEGRRFPEALVRRGRRTSR